MSSVERLAGPSARGRGPPDGPAMPRVIHEIRGTRDVVDNTVDTALGAV